MEMESEYLVRNPNLVAGHLKDIIKNRCIITAHFGAEALSYMTCIVSVDTKKQLVEIDCAPTDSMNAKLLAAPNVLFRTEFDGINVSFTGQEIRQIKTDRGVVFVMPLPDSIFWMQRRQCYRMKIPEHYHCAIEFVVNPKCDDDHSMAKSMRFNVVDISISGFAFHNVSPVLPDYLLPAAKYSDCVLQLDDKLDNTARISCQIININKIRTNKSVVAQRIGCRFTEFPPGFDAVLWRYVQNLELHSRDMRPQ